MNKELINKTVETETNRLGNKKYTKGTFLISYFMYGGTQVNGEFVLGKFSNYYPRFADSSAACRQTRLQECLKIAKKYGHTHYKIQKSLYVDPVNGGWLDMNEQILGEFVQ
tara:strand:+ start:945 stop:1277 length:333 start_codon:yes stop_codon:yes gene_type:complete